ncbi:hypothetical protein ABW19_dt0200317 [Dactylella cylindrospora]|nr:hypothetical protein ABW19_dt0200317 [Dactylella cylindrospora]
MRDWPHLDFHGTAVLSKIVSPKVGLAPEADIVFVQAYNKFGYNTPANFFDAMIKAYDHIIKTNPPHAVMCMAWGYEEGPTFDVLSRYRDTYDPPSSPLKATQMGMLAPARDQRVYPDMIVVAGASSRNDQKMQHEITRGVKINAWAPGEDVYVATYTVKGSATLWANTGSSFATGTIAGMIAAYISEGTPLKKVIERLYNTAYPRVPGGPNIIYNGIMPNEWPIDVSSEPFSEDFYGEWEDMYNS